MSTLSGQLLVREKSELQIVDRAAWIVGLRDEGLLLWEIAERAEVTMERVRQILAKASANGYGPNPPKQVVTRQASLLLGMPPEMRPGSFQRLMAKLDVTPIVRKRGRLYWSVESLKSIELPRCVVCSAPVPLSRYARSITCSSRCSSYRRSHPPGKERELTAP